MTNIDEVFEFLTAQGQSPRLRGDAYITLELMGHRLDREVERLFDEATEKGLEGLDLTRYIDDHICMANVLKTTVPRSIIAMRKSLLWPASGPFSRRPSTWTPRISVNSFPDRP